MATKVPSDIDPGMAPERDQQLSHRGTFSIAEWCRYRGICPATFYNHLQRGEMPATLKIGRRTLITTEADSEKIDSLRADERRQKQILLNLMTNAVKFTPRGGQIVVRVTEDKAGHCVFAVEDTGIGIAQEDQARVFEPFVQAGYGPSKRQEGTGLGLPLTKQLVELHGGSLELRNEVGAGTTMIVRLPAARMVRRRLSGMRTAASAA
jgi:signal transduction histidine kinase